MRNPSVVLFLSFVISVAVASKRQLDANGAFGKYHTINELGVLFECNDTAYVDPSNADQITLNVSKTTYSTTDQINVTWTSHPTPCTDDFIGIYPTDSPLSAVCDYFDYQLTSHRLHSREWTMLNIRRPLEFRYYSRDRNCSGNYIYMGKSATVEPVNYNEPVHVHIAFADRPDQMFVSYLTNSSQYTPQCQYGFDPSSLTFVQNGTSITYKASDMCEEKANKTGPQYFIDPGYIHTILLEDLRPSTTYYYRVGTNEHGWSAVYSFINRPADDNTPVTIVAYADMGATANARNTIERVTALATSTNISCLLHVGDISYARGTSVIWEAFMTQIQPMAARVPYMVSIGNHEYDHETGGEKDPSGAPTPGGFRPSWGNYGHDSGGECAVPMVRRFRSPSNGNGLFWYSFEVGPIHIIIFSTEHDFQKSTKQYNWIEQDLQSVNRTRTPWIIIGSHRIMFSSEKDPADLRVAQQIQLNLEPLFYKYHVDVNLFGHLHAYERSCAMFQEKCVSDGITNALIGMAGIALDDRPYSTNPWSQYHDQQYGYTTIYANKTYLHFQYYHNDDTKVIDQFVLQK